MADLSGQQLGAYYLIERIGRGGMSDVYRAQASETGAEVAIKVLSFTDDHEENRVFLQRFQREAKIITSLQHPHLLPLLDYNTAGEAVYFVMPLIKGGTLAELVRRGALDPAAVVHWISQLADALDHAHHINVVHRDLKPTNVLLDENGDAYLTDFGIAWLTSTTTTSGLTQTGTVVGTPGYMAPEQWRAEKLDARTDVYGLAVMSYLMLCGRLPFEADTAHAMMYQHLDQMPPRLQSIRPELPMSLDLVVQKALAKRAEERYQSAGEFAAELRKAVAGLPLTYDLASAPTPPSSAQPTIPTPAIQSPIEYPPPVYTAPRNPPPTPTGHQASISQTSPSSPTNSGYYYPIPPKLRQRHRRQRRWVFLAFGGSALVVMLSILTLAAALGVFSDLFSSNLFSNDNGSSTNTPPPTATNSDQQPSNNGNTSSERPRLTIISPTDNNTFERGQVITIRVSASHAEGVSRIELRRFGLVLDSQTAPSAAGLNPFETELSYTPDGIGELRLELIAYHGATASESQFLRVIIQQE